MFRKDGTSRIALPFCCMRIAYVIHQGWTICNLEVLNFSAIIAKQLGKDQGNYTSEYWEDSTYVPDLYLVH